MRTFLISLTLLLPLWAGDTQETRTAMKTAVEAFLGQLDADRKKQAVFAFNDASRENFRFTPRERTGLCLKDMTPNQRSAAMNVLKTILSQKGYLKATEIMALEGVLAKIENRPEFRDPEKYYLSVFGTPGNADGWGWKFEGHHLSLNYTIVGDTISVTPSFMGSNPAEVLEGEHKGLRVLHAEEDLAIALAKKLIAEGHKDVIFSNDTPKEILTREEREATVLQAVGVKAGEMTDDQKEKLMELIGVYLNRHRESLAEADMKKIKAAGIDEITFGWSGATERGEAWYYRIQGPTFLMEAANSQNNANHVHTTWREFKGDFGRDVLGEHYHGGSHDH